MTMRTVLRLSIAFR